MALLRDEPRSLGVARRAALIFALWIGFWSLAVAVVAGLLYVPYAQAQYGGDVGASGFVAIAAAISLLFALRPRFAGREARGTNPLARSRAPELYALVERIGARAGVKAPIAIHLRSESNASIAATRHWHGGIRRLDVSIGYGLLCILSEAELGSVIAHEYGHFVGGDLGLTPWVYRIRTSIGRTLGSLESSIFLLDWPFRAYASWFLRHSATISRAQEYAADALAARLAGAEATCAALEKVHDLGAMWSVYFAQDLVPSIHRGARLPIRAGFITFLDSTSRRAAVAQSIENEQARAPGPFDTHPSLDERIAAVTSSWRPGTQAVAECLALLGPEAEAIWYECFIQGALRACSWETFGDDILLPAIRSRFANTFLAPERVPLTALVELVADTESLWARTKPDGLVLMSRLARRNYVLDILREFAIASLCASGYRLRAHPGEPLLMSRGDRAVRPDELLEQVCDGRIGAPQLEALAASC
jgi:Zn-dependent protease with chaperone function